MFLNKEQLSETMWFPYNKWGIPPKEACVEPVVVCTKHIDFILGRKLFTEI